MRVSLLFAVGVMACSGSPATNDQAPLPDTHVADTEVADTNVSVDTSLPDSAPQRKGPPYPIVLAHGFFGFEDFAGAGFINYFYGVREDLAKTGESAVYTPAVDPFNSSEYRGKQLAAHIEKILTETNAAKVNIIGHSQGGLDARVVAHDHPDWVASVITVGTPHEGVPVADIALRIEPHSDAAKVIDMFSRLAGRALYDTVGNETSLASAVRQFATATMRDFNAKYPDTPSIPYFSIAGRSGLHSGGADCATSPSEAPDFIRALATELDATDPLLKPTETILSGTTNAPNDGMVRVRDARRGTFLGCIPADHLDEMGHLLGDSPGPGNDFNHLAFYRSLVRFVRDRGR